MKKRDLLIVCQYFYPDHVSTGRLPSELAVDLASKGLTVDVLCGYPSYMVFGPNEANVPKRETYKGVNIRRIRMPKFDKNNKLGRLLNYLSFSAGVFLRFFTFRRYKRIFLLTNPPLLPYFGYLSKKIFHNKFLFLIYDLYPDIALALKAVEKGSVLVKVMNFVNKRAFKAADRIIVIGEDMKRYLINNKGLQDTERIDIIPNWIDSDTIALKDKVNAFSIKEELTDRFVVLYSGNIGLFQDLEMLVECARLLKDYSEILFVFVGEGGKKKKLMEMVRTYGLENVRFYGFQPDEIYNDVLASANCFVVTLEKAAEGLGVPSKTYTYLAAGRPLIGILSENTDVGRMIIDEEIGFQIDHGEVQDLTGRILYLYHNKKEWSEMGARARQLLLKRYDRRIATEKYYKLFQDC